MIATPLSSCFFFFNDTATTEIYPLSLHDALPIFREDLALDVSARLPRRRDRRRDPDRDPGPAERGRTAVPTDRKSTRLNSSHSQISYAVFCLKKKKKETVELHSNT